jgi:hypothetical protein
MANKAVVLSVVFGLLASWSPAAGLEIGPDADLCAALSQVQPGEELLLQPGEYRGGCVVRRGGLPGAPVIIRAADPDRRPHLTRPGQAVNMLEIRASDVTIQGRIDTLISARWATGIKGKWFRPERPE